MGTKDVAAIRKCALIIRFDCTRQSSEDERRDDIVLKHTHWERHHNIIGHTREHMMMNDDDDDDTDDGVCCVRELKTNNTHAHSRTHPHICFFVYTIWLDTRPRPGDFSLIDALALLSL